MPTEDTDLRKTEAPAPPVDAATVMLVRDGRDGVEVFMMQRHGKADFGGAWVFPGGVAAVTDAETDLEAFCAGLDDAGASAQLGLSGGGLRFWVAGIRETFEESGYLLACDAAGHYVDPGAAGRESDFARYRSDLDAGRMSALDLCRREGLRLACDRMHYVSFWTTPTVLPRRYATRFFVAGVPPGQHGVHDGRETVESLWVRPCDALEPAMRKRLRLHPPTVSNLALIRDFRDSGELLDAMAALDKSSIEEILPRVVANADGHRVLMPWDEGYAEAG
jgi:8-oxo-dGTP pyrophosphatase MutT (NUDIX family)